jgi:hypothetical protein
MAAPIGFPTQPECDCNFILPMSKEPCIGDTLDVMFYNISALNVAFQKFIKRSAGKIQIHAGSPNDIPADEILCDGSSYEPSEFPQLFARLGYRHGKSGSKFLVPDYRGQFLRGVDMGAGNDPNASSRTAPASGGQSGDTVGSAQGHAFQKHTHSSEVKLWKQRHSDGRGSGRHVFDLTYLDKGPDKIYAAGGATSEPIKSSSCSTLQTACETRPVNKNVLFTITTGECVF